MKVTTVLLFAFSTAAIIGHYLAFALLDKTEKPPELISLSCLLENTPCSQEEQVYKDEILNLMQTNCKECNSTLKVLLRELLWRLKEWVPEDYKRLSHKYHLKN